MGYSSSSYIHEALLNQSMSLPRWGNAYRVYNAYDDNTIYMHIYLQLHNLGVLLKSKHL